MKTMVKILSFLFCFLLFTCADKENAQVSPLESLTVKDGQVYYYLRHAEKNFKVMFLADTHFTKVMLLFCGISGNKAI